MLVPQFNRLSDLVEKVKSFTLVLVLFVGLVCRGLEKEDTTKSYDVIYMLIYAPVVNAAWYLSLKYRKEQIIKKL